MSALPAVLADTAEISANGTRCTHGCPSSTRPRHPCSSSLRLTKAAKLVRAIVVGPIARLELLPLDASAAGSGDIIEAQIPAQQFTEMGFKDGETLVLTPRKARVFVAPA